MYRQLYEAAVILGLLPSLAAAGSGIIQVTGIRSWSHAGWTRVIIQTSGPFVYRSDRAYNPDRLFIDIADALPWIDHQHAATYAVGDGNVRQVRIAETAPHTTRVVFDLTGRIDFTISRLNAPDRMVIEIHPFGKSMPAPRSLAKTFVYPAPPPHQRVSLPSTPPPIAPMPAASAPSLASLPDPQWPASKLADRVAKPLQTRAAPTAAIASQNAGRSLTRALGLKVNRIVIDAGHGGHDDGTIGPHGVLEKDVVLDVALRLARLVQDRMGVEVVLTRSDDTFIPLHERTAIANERKADLFLSIHANSSPAPEVAGTETFFLNVSSSPGAVDVAARENAGSENSVGELRDLIQSITTNDKIEESRTFAQDVQDSIQAQDSRANANAQNRGVKRAPFVVLIGASMPSVLAEIGFLSNDREEANLNKPEYRQKVAEALYKGVLQYSQSLSHFEAAARPNH